ncbi:MAG: tryptophan synthase subunit alpha, partial [Planctomycetes bacterium]|nr:tryptophan synthase subunit alpha [Planctomycetota bacterium]
MSRIDDIFSGLRRDGRKALMPFVCGGYPRPGLLARILPELERAGASVVEVGIPFSGPIADGPVVAAA